MGLENRAEGKYITIYDGKMCQRVDKSVEGAVERTNKLGKIVHEKFYDKFTGNLVSIKVTDGQYGKQWNFGFRDAGDLYTLQLGYTNSFATNFLKMLPNIDLEKVMTVTPKTVEEDGKKKNSLFVNQDGVSIKHKYTKDNPNGLPPWKNIVVKGVEVGDNTDQMVFLEKMVQTDIIPKLHGAVAEAGMPPTGGVPVEEEVVEEDEIAF